MMNELRSMKGLIEERFGALAFMEKLQRQPAQARLTQKLLDCGFSPALIRKLAEGLAADIDRRIGVGRRRARAQPADRRATRRRSKTRAASTRWSAPPASARPPAPPSSRPPSPPSTAPPTSA